MNSYTMIFVKNGAFIYPTKVLPDSNSFFYLQIKMAKGLTLR
mgnify:CR=1 FL=1